MNELDKLAHLLNHWKEHNKEHAGTYREWAVKAASLGRTDLAGILDRLYLESMKMDKTFDEAIKKTG